MECVVEGRKIGQDHPPYVIAEMSANHGGDFERALRILEQSQKAGADAIKFQAYDAEAMTLNSLNQEFVIQHKSLWEGKRLYELYAAASTPYAWLPDLFARARELQITPFASVFDAKGIDFLENCGAPAYKIASFESIDLPLIRLVAQTGKPVFLSTGLCTFVEMERSLEAFYGAGGKEIVLLKCTSQYPAPMEGLQLKTVPAMAARFGVPIGFSDHSAGNMAAVCAVALGACVLEKHVIDDPNPPTFDSEFSMTTQDLAGYVQAVRQAHAALGQVWEGPVESEVPSLMFRRSLYFVENLKQGTVLTPAHVRSVRPGYGLAPMHWDAVIGKALARDVTFAEPVSWEALV